MTTGNTTFTVRNCTKGITRVLLNANRLIGRNNLTTILITRRYVNRRNAIQWKILIHFTIRFTIFTRPQIILILNSIFRYIATTTTPGKLGISLLHFYRTRNRLVAIRLCFRQITRKHRLSSHCLYSKSRTRVRGVLTRHTLTTRSSSCNTFTGFRFFRHRQSISFSPCVSVFLLC